MSNGLRNLNANTITVGLYGEIVALGGVVGVWENGAITVGTPGEITALQTRFGVDAVVVANDEMIADVVDGQQYRHPSNKRCPMPPRA